MNYKWLVFVPLFLALTLGVAFLLSPYVGYLAGATFAIAVQTTFWYMFLHERSDAKQGV
jgi:hypothetical protein